MYEACAGAERHGQQAERETDLGGSDSIGEQECKSEGPAENGDEAKGAVCGRNAFALRLVHCYGGREEDKCGLLGSISMGRKNWEGLRPR